MGRVAGAASPLSKKQRMALQRVCINNPVYPRNGNERQTMESLVRRGLVERDRCRYWATDAGWELRDELGSAGMMTP